MEQESERLHDGQASFPARDERSRFQTLRIIAHWYRMSSITLKVRGILSLAVRTRERGSVCGLKAQRSWVNRGSDSLASAVRRCS